MKSRRLVTLTLAVFITTALFGVASPAIAQTQPRHAAVLVPPAHRVDGKTGGQLLGEVWRTSYSLPAAENPLNGHYRCIHLGRTGRVVWVAGPITCTARVGSALLIYGASSACSNVEDPPDFGADAAAQRACAKAANQVNASATAVIDGAHPIELISPRYEVFSPQQHVQLPPDNLLGLDPQPATLSAHGWVAVLVGLRPGLHTVTVHRQFTDGTSFDFQYALQITHGS
jgi:hypothetical protein